MVFIFTDRKLSLAKLVVIVHSLMLTKYDMYVRLSMYSSFYAVFISITILRYELVQNVFISLFDSKLVQ